MNNLTAIDFICLVSEEQGWNNLSREEAKAILDECLPALPPNVDFVYVESTGEGRGLFYEDWKKEVGEKKDE